ncbi:MAG: hypothetical protein VB099_01155 [Candidatus Limiplasma sp.]|nr:hypothetical protein [Candidatus Limiplasma sp.]
MYSKLAEMVRKLCHSNDVNIRVAARTIYDKATGGGCFSVQEAVGIRDTYFPGMQIEDLFAQDMEAPPQITTAEAVSIMAGNPCWMEAYPQLLDTVYNYVSDEIQALHGHKGSIAAIAYALLIGRAQGVREERARRQGRE